MIAVHANNRRSDFVKKLLKLNSNLCTIPKKLSDSWLKKTEAVIYIGFAEAISDRKYKNFKNHGIPIIYIDTGIFNQYSKENYFSVSVNGLKYLGLDYINHNFDTESWEKINKNLSFQLYDSYNGSKYSILMHNRASALSIKRSKKGGQTSIYDVKRSLVRNKKSFQVSEHPNGNGKTLDTETILETSKCCIGWHSNALCIAALHRIPVICLDKINFASPMSCEGIKKLSIPTNEKRLEWLNFISNCQFTKEQILDLSFIDKIKPYMEILNEKRKVSNL